MTNGAHELGDLLGGELADACEGTAQVLLFGCELGLMREAAPGATAADTDERTGRLDAIGGGLEDLLDYGA
ncbi:Uncharacterised protein [Collinsella intestinalis]|nr:Uncharacterised protein [Collinsella intestinalis]